MNEESIADLTSAEAGFLYAFAQSGRQGASDWTVDEITAAPLAEMIKSGDVSNFDELDEAFERGRYSQWAGRHDRALGDDRDQGVEQFVELITDNESSEAARYVARQRLGQIMTEMGRDFTLLSPRRLDLRRWFDAGHEHRLGLRLVIVGAVLISTVERVAIRRQLASMIRELPPSVQQQVRSGMTTFGTPNQKTSRRIFEVYCNIAGQDCRTDEIFALVGLFFVVSAGIFRQNGVIHRIESNLSSPLDRYCQRFRQACIGSGKPELSPEIAELIRPLIGIDQENGKESQDE